MPACGAQTPMDDRIASRESEPPSTSDSLANSENEEPPSRRRADPAVAVIGSRTRKIHRFPISPHSDRFRRRFFSQASAADWNDWRGQARSGVRGGGGGWGVVGLSDDEREAISRHTGSLPL